MGPVKSKELRFTSAESLAPKRVCMSFSWDWCCTKQTRGSQAGSVILFIFFKSSIKLEKKSANADIENSSVTLACSREGAQHRLTYSRGFQAIIASCVRSRGGWSIAWPSVGPGEGTAGNRTCWLHTAFVSVETCQKQDFSCSFLWDYPVSQGADETWVR